MQGSRYPVREDPHERAGRRRDGPLSRVPDIRTAIVEPRKEARAARAALIEGTPGYRLTGAFASADTAREGLDRQPPDVLLFCIEARGGRNTAIRAIKDRYPAMQVLVLAGGPGDPRRADAPDTATREEIFATIAAGASGYLVRDTPPVRLLEAIRELRDGGAPMSPNVARVVVESFHLPSSPGNAPARLSSREQETLRLLAAGHSYKTAAGEMNLSIDTVRFHIRNIYEKLHVHSKIEAVLKAERDGLVP